MRTFIERRSLDGSINENRFEYGMTGTYEPGENLTVKSELRNSDVNNAFNESQSYNAKIVRIEAEYRF